MGQLGFIIGMIILVYKPSLYRDFLIKLLRPKVIMAKYDSTAPATPITGICEALYIDSQATAKTFLESDGVTSIVCDDTIYDEQNNANALTDSQKETEYKKI